MRKIIVAPVVAVMLSASPASAQDTVEFNSREEVELAVKQIFQTRLSVLAAFRSPEPAGVVACERWDETRADRRNDYAIIGAVATWDMLEYGATYATTSLTKSMETRMTLMNIDMSINLYCHGLRQSDAMTLEELGHRYPEID